MASRNLKYLLVYLTPVIVLLSIASGDGRSFAAIVLLFGIIPLIELFTQGSVKNPEPLEEQSLSAEKKYDWILYGLLPAQIITVIYFLRQIGVEDYGVGYRTGAILAFGLSCGILGINAAHELGHRRTWYEQLMSKMLLLTTLYMHFFIEHNRGHHKKVSTDEDPASGREGEMIYTFYLRSIGGSWWSAWKLESERLRQRKMPFWGLHNEMLVYQGIQLGYLALIGMTFGGTILCYYVIAALIGIHLLESVNYIEHYGLRRARIGSGYERPLPVHSWNSNHPLGRLMLLELSRHSDHHYNATRKYQILRHFDQSPQMPTGYPGMILLALIPPLWFRVMNPRLAQIRQATNT